MRPTDLSVIEIADLLNAAYREDRRLAGDGPGGPERLVLADYLGCHEEAWEVWRNVLELEGHNDLNDAEY